MDKQYCVKNEKKSTTITRVNIYVVNMVTLTRNYTTKTSVGMVEEYK